MSTSEKSDGSNERTTCDKPTEYYITPFMAYACVLPRDHEGRCQPGGTCMKHGPWIGARDGLVQCPQWPDCIVDGNKIETNAKAVRRN